VTPQRPEPIGVVLAGGLGRRIGGAKALVELCGRPLISYPVAALQSVLSEVAILAKADTELPSLPGVTVWIESAPLRHPLVGIIEALGLAGGRPVLVCASDLPFVDAALLRGLIAVERGDAPAVVASLGGELQPLLALYAPAAAPLLRDALAGGVPPLREAVAALGPKRYKVEQPESLFNVNAPEDVLRASAMLDANRR
jgi:molybdopterin-guanine dinucleotide biosynthesis protein A